MKKVAIITITVGTNYGNRLQNYAVQEVLKTCNIQSETLEYQFPKTTISEIKKILKHTVFYSNYKSRLLREKNFKLFNDKYIQFSQYKISNDSIPEKILSMYDYFVAGSDQIWNLNYPENGKVFFLGFCNKEKKVAYAPSFGTEIIPADINPQISKWIKDIPHLSVREDAGLNIIKQLTGRTDVEVLIDPTMMLCAEEWDRIIEKPVEIGLESKYILVYFLGNVSKDRWNEIRRIAQEQDCRIIDLTNVRSKNYQIGPAEFLYLEKHAQLICTDSFHSCVFAMLYHRPFIVFERDDETVSMNSRIDTLLEKFQLTERYFKGKIYTELLVCNYENAEIILEQERKKALYYLKNAFEIRD